MAFQNKRFLCLILALFISVNLKFCTSLDDVIIDLEADLEKVGSASRWCSYVRDMWNIFCQGVPQTRNHGFWTSCVNNNCELTIEVGKLGGYNEVPTYFRVLSFVKGSRSNLKLSYKINATEPAKDLPPDISDLTAWTTSIPYNLSEIDGINPKSIILFKLTSNLIAFDAAVIDRIIFNFGSEGGTSTVDIPETTQVPTDPNPTQTETTYTTTTYIPETTTVGQCPPGIYCTATDRYNQKWTACVGETARKDCPKYANGTATWFCQENGKFQGATPDYSKCANDWLGEVEKEIAQGIPILPEKADDLLNKIGSESSQGGYFGHEIENIFGLTGRVLSLVMNDTDVEKFEGLTDSGWTILGDILRNKDPWEEISIANRTQTGSKFISTLEDTALGLSGRVSMIKNKETEDSIYRRNFQKEEFRILAGVQSTEKNQSGLSFPDNYSENESHINLPSDWAAYFVGQNITFTGVSINPGISNFVFPGSLNSIGPEGNSSAGKFLNSHIMGFTFGDDIEGFQMESLAATDQFSRMNFTGNGVRITFQHERTAWGEKVMNVRRRLHSGEQPKAVRDSSACVYWDPHKLTWSSEGCKVITTERSESICECNHLTAFALLVDVHNYIGKDLGLEILTLVLCPISIICLAICIYIFSTVQSERSTRNALTRNLCICLLVGNLLMIFLMDKHYFYLSDGVCVASAVAIHYVFLCAMFWMALEGANILKVLFLDVFGQSKDYLIFQYISAYGIPALIVGATGLITGLKGDHGYGNDTFCWLNGPYIWAFLGPTTFVLMANLVILILSLRKALSLKNKHQSGEKRRKSLAWLKGCFSLSTLLGLTWIVGYFMMIDHSTIANIAAYIFTILNASQGIFLFVFHGIMNSKFRAILRRRLHLSSSWRSSGRRPTQPTLHTDVSFGARVRQSFSGLKNMMRGRSSSGNST